MEERDFLKINDDLSNVDQGIFNFQLKLFETFRNHSKSKTDNRNNVTIFVINLI